MKRAEVLGLAALKRSAKNIMKLLILVVAFFSLSRLSGQIAIDTQITDQLLEFGNEEAIGKRLRARNCGELLAYATVSAELSAGAVKCAFTLYPNEASQQFESSIEELFSRKVNLATVNHIGKFYSGLFLSGAVDRNIHRNLSLLNCDFVTKRMTRDKRDLLPAGLSILEMVFFSVASAEELNAEEKALLWDLVWRLGGDKCGSITASKILTHLSEGFSANSLRARLLEEDCGTLEGAISYAWLKLHKPKMAHQIRDEIREGILTYSDLYNFESANEHSSTNKTSEQSVPPKSDRAGG